MTNRLRHAFSIRALLFLTLAAAVASAVYTKRAMKYERQEAILARLRPHGLAARPAGSGQLAVQLFYDDEVARLEDGRYEPLSPKLVQDRRNGLRWWRQNRRKVVFAIVGSEGNFQELEELARLPWLQQLVVCGDRDLIRRFAIRDRVEKSMGTDVELFICTSQN